MTIGDTALIGLSASMYLLLPADVFVVIVVIAVITADNAMARYVMAFSPPPPLSLLLTGRCGLWRRTYSPGNDEGPAFAGVPP